MVVPPWHIEICCRPERQQLRLERCPLTAKASPPQGERLREQTVGVKRFSLAGTAVSLCKNKEMGVHIQSKRRWSTPPYRRMLNAQITGHRQRWPFRARPLLSTERAGGAYPLRHKRPPINSISGAAPSARSVPRFVPRAGFTPCSSPSAQRNRYRALWRSGRSCR